MADKGVGVGRGRQMDKGRERTHIYRWKPWRQETDHRNGLRKEKWRPRGTQRGGTERCTPFVIKHSPRIVCVSSLGM